MSHERRIDTVVIGGSAGALGLLKSLLIGLPANFPAAIFVCLHKAHLHPTSLADLLRSDLALPIVNAEDGHTIETGKIYVASHDSHLLIGSDHIHLRRGAQENNFRPAIDPLFRSAAVYRGARTVAVLLSGLLDDGAVGSRVISSANGQVLVLDPTMTEYPDMPTAALRINDEAQSMSLEDLSKTLRKLAGSPAGEDGALPWSVGIELKIASMEGNTVSAEERLGELTPYNCPHCNGVLWEIDDPDIVRFRCHTGHAYTADALNVAQEQALDEGLWNAFRAHQGRAELLRRLSQSTKGNVSKELMKRRAIAVEEDAQRLEAIIQQRKSA